MAVEDANGSGDAARRGWPIMVALVLAEVLSSFESSMIYAALASFYKSFQDPVGVGWLVTGYMLVASISAAICARLGDMYGRRRVLIIVIAISGAGSVLSALGHTLPLIIAGRSIQGFAGAILPLCYGLVREHFPDTRLSVNIGIISATASGGAAIGVIVGGLLVDHGHWRLIFVSSAMLAVVAAVVVAVLVPAARVSGRRQKIDWMGAGLFIVGLWLALYALSVGETSGWGGNRQIALAVTGLAMLTAWYFHELRTANPMISVRMMFDRRVGLTLAIFALVAIGTLNFSQVIQLMLQQPIATGAGFGVSATLSGIIKLPGTLLGVVASPIIGWYAGRRGARRGMILATAALALSWFGLALMHGNVAVIFGWLLLNGFGIGAIMAAAPNLIVIVAPADRTSEATGLVQIIRKIAMACGAQMIAVSLAVSTVRVQGGVYPDALAFDITCGWIFAANLLAMILSFLLPRDHVVAREPNRKLARMSQIGNAA